MGIPDAVARQAEESEAALDAAASEGVTPGQQQPPQPPTAPEAPDSGNQPPHQPPTAVVGGQVVTLEQLGKAPGQPGAAPAPGVALNPEQQIEQANQRWRTAQGMITARDKEIAELKEKAATPPDTPPSTPPAFSGGNAYQAHLSEDEREDYETRDDALGVSGRAALGVFEAQFAALRDELTARLDRNDQFRLELQETKQEDEVWSAVEAISPGARDINSSSNATWMDYLSGSDPHNPAQTIQQLAQKRYESGDVQGLAALVDDYKQKYGWSPQDSASFNSDLISGQVKPSRAAGQAPAAQPQVQMILESEITKFYEDRVKGDYDDRQEEATRIEAAIEAANDEGRILIGQ